MMPCPGPLQRRHPGAQTRTASTPPLQLGRPPRLLRVSIDERMSTFGDKAPEQASILGGGSVVGCAASCFLRLRIRGLWGTTHGATQR